MTRLLNTICYVSFCTSVTFCFMFEFEAAAVAVVIGGLAALADFIVN